MGFSDGAPPPSPWTRFTVGAYEYLSRVQYTQHREALLTSFFRACFSHKEIEVLLRLPLTPEDGQCLEGVLRALPEETAQDTLFVYYVQHHRFIEAARYHAELRQSGTRSQERAALRQGLVANCLRILPAYQVVLRGVWAL